MTPTQDSDTLRSRALRTGIARGSFYTALAAVEELEQLRAQDKAAFDAVDADMPDAAPAKQDSSYPEIPDNSATQPTARIAGKFER